MAPGEREPLSTPGAPGPLPELSVEVVEDAGDAERVAGAWDALAVARGRPFCSPGWMLAWWRHAAPAGAALRLVVARDGSDVAGIAPLWVDRRGGLVRYRPLASSTASRAEPLAAPGMEAAVARAVAGALASARPRPDVVAFSAIAASSPWPELLRGAWPGRRPLLRAWQAMPAPAFELDTDGVQPWPEGLSRNERQKLRRRRRRALEAGASFRVLSDPGEIVRALPDFAAMHYARWSDRGGSASLDPGVERMLADAAARLAPEGRLRLLTLEAEGRPVASHLFVCAGATVSYWLGGFDEAWAWASPSLLVLGEALEQAGRQGLATFDLGPGGQDYKYLFATGEERLAWLDLAPVGPRLPLTLARLAPAHARGIYVDARGAAIRRLSPRAKHRLRQVRSALRRRAARG